MATLFRSIRRRSISSVLLPAFKSEIDMDKLFTSIRQCNISSARLFAKYYCGSIIGIDLGTTNSRVAIMQDNVAKVLHTIPSVVAFNNGNFIVGTPAKRQVISNLTETYFGTKRLIGSHFNDSRVQEQLQLVPYTIVKGRGGDVSLEADGNYYSTITIVAMIIAKLKETVEGYLRDNDKEPVIKGAVISVPASFNDFQRQATKLAGQKAGVVVQSIIDEPIASAVSFALNNENKTSFVAVVDIGGGSFDVAVIQIHNKHDLLSLKVSKVKAINGDADLGGLDFDEIVADYLISEFKRTHGIHLSTNRVAHQRVRANAEIAKIALAEKDETHVHIPFIISDSYGSKDLNIFLTRSIFEAQVNPAINQIKRKCEICLDDAQIKQQEVDEVLLVGGMSHIPIVQQVVAEVFGRTPNKSADPYESVALGALLHGAENMVINVEPRHENDLILY